MASDAAEDGRPLVVFTLADCDPSGRQMPISIGRKLQALRDALFPDLEVEIVVAGLEPEQALALGLPSSPLKEKEMRAGRWIREFGVEQTEIDALATLRPDALVEMVEQAIAPYFDATLAERVEEAEEEWRAEVEALIADGTDAKLDFGQFMRRMRAHFPCAPKYGVEFRYCPGVAGT